jgi:hypothetical protein
MFRLVLDHHFRQCEDTPSAKEHSLPALFFVEAEDVGSDRVNLLGTQNNIGHAWVRGPGKKLLWRVHSSKAYG